MGCSQLLWMDRHVLANGKNLKHNKCSNCAPAHCHRISVLILKCKDKADKQKWDSLPVTFIFAKLTQRKITLTVWFLVCNHFSSNSRKTQSYHTTSVSPSKMVQILKILKNQLRQLNKLSRLVRFSLSKNTGGKMTKSIWSLLLFLGISLYKCGHCHSIRDSGLLT